MQKDYCTADQESDINVIYLPLIKHLELKLHSAQKLDLKILSMTVADRTKTELNY